MAKYPPKAAIQAAGHEMKKEPPKILAKTKRKKGKAAAEKQRVAIMLDKARRGSEGSVKHKGKKFRFR